MTEEQSPSIKPKNRNLALAVVFLPIALGAFILLLACSE
jgi:hypothetical protein